MKILSNAKINLGLSVIKKRKDGFHEIESLFLPIPWCDELEIKKADELNFTTSGISIDGNLEQNLCLKAYRILKAQFPISPVHIHLKKQIPIGAGLGGGSSNAAFVLKGLNEIFKLQLSVKTLENFADQLGSDCSFFIQNKPAVVSGKGDVLDTNLDFSLSAYCLVVYPNLHVSTQKAYGLVQPSEKSTSIVNLAQLPINEWQGNIINDFEEEIVGIYPELEKLKMHLQELGASYVSMSGSGSSFFAFFDHKPIVQLGFSAYEWRLFELVF